MNTEMLNTQNLDFKDLLKLDKFFAPKILLVLYWITMVFLLLGGIFTFLGGIGAIFSPYGSALVGLGTMVGGLIIVTVGALYLRLLFETMTVFFSMNEKLRVIRDK